jgi:hypothetical protein
MGKKTRMGAQSGALAFLFLIVFGVVSSGCDAFAAKGGVLLKSGVSKFPSTLSPSPAPTVSGCPTSSTGTIYFISSSVGNDSLTATQAQNCSTPWQSLSKLNSFFPSLLPGDSVLFKRGDRFYGTINVTKSGISGRPIILGAYGTGADPVVSGFTSVTAWTNLGGNIWESSSAVSTLSSMRMVRINGVNTPVGRYPNSGYLQYQTYTGNTSITSGSLTGTPSWTGAEVVIRKNNWILDRGIITSQSGGTLTYTGGGYNGSANWGFFIQNHPGTLDTQGEWYFNPSTEKLRIYSASTPTGVEGSTVDNLLNLQGQSYLTIDGLDFVGSNRDSLYLDNASSITIQNSSVIFSGHDGVHGSTNGSSSGFVLRNCKIDSTNNNSVLLSAQFAGAQLIGNQITNNALFAGAGDAGDGTYYSMRIDGDNSVIQSNRVIGSGYVGIGFNGANTNVSYNFVTNFCSVKEDGAGIYTSTAALGKVISYNTILNGIGNSQGNPDGVTNQANGIYNDDASTGISVIGNTIANMPGEGIAIHNATSITIRSNVLYNNGATDGGGISIRTDNTNDFLTGMNVTDNRIVARTSNQRTLKMLSVHDDVATWGTFDSNYYARPIDDAAPINVVKTLPFYTDTNYSLSGWQSLSGQDIHSHRSPKSISDVSALRFEYNETGSPKSIALDTTYIDVTGATHSGSLTLPAYSSIVLIR